MSAPQSRTAVKAARTDEPEALKGAFILPRLIRRFRCTRGGVRRACRDAGSQCWSRVLAGRAGRSSEGESAVGSARRCSARRRCETTRSVSWGNAPRKATLAAAGRRRPELPQGREHSELRSWAPSSVRTGPRMSFSPPQSMGCDAASANREAVPPKCDSQALERGKQWFALVVISVRCCRGLVELRRRTSGRRHLFQAMIALVCVDWVTGSDEHRLAVKPKWTC